jgi:hypothetical protein
LWFFFIEDVFNLLDERGGYEDLRGSVHQNVISYFYRRTELYCSSLSCLSLSICSSL